MKRPIQKLALVALSLLSTLVVAAQTTFAVGDLLYTVLDAGEQTVSVKANVSSYTGALTIPATVDNEGVTYRVTKVADNGFNGNDAITSITFEGSNLEEIGAAAFKDTKGVTGTVTIPASVKVIEYDGFCRCYADAFVFAEGSQLERLGRTNGDGDVFWQCTFTQMPNLPSTITSFGNRCFYQCNNLTEAILPEGITEIPSYTFYGCSAVETVTIPSTVTKIGRYAFQTCTGITSLTIPNTVTEIGSYAFQSCAKLESVHYSTGMTIVPENCFDLCYALASVDGLDNVTRFESAAFGNCRGFTSFTFPANLEYIGQYAVGDLRNCESYTFAGNKVKEIAYAAFQYNTKLTSITIPNSVETMGTHTFQYCELLTDVTLPTNEKFTYLPASIFYGTNIKSFDIPSQITEIGGSAFWRSNLASVTLPSSLTRINDSAFAETDITSFDIPAGVILGASVFQGCKQLASVTLPEGLTEIPNYTFDGCNALAGAITIPATVTRIGRDAFRYCNNITEVIFPDNSQLQVIDYEAFYMDYHTSKLERFIMPNTVTTLGNGALRGCKKLDWDNFHLSTGVTSLPGHMFCDCGFTKFPLEETNVTELAYNVFDGNCFTEFHLPANITYGDATFNDCEQLERFYFADGADVPAIKSYMFDKCYSLSYIYLPVTTVPDINYAGFYNKKQIFLDVPAEAISTFKANSAWADFKYVMTLESTGATPLALDDAAIRYWDVYDYQGHRYLYNDQYTSSANFDRNLMSWTFDNTVEKEYSLLFNACNRIAVNPTDMLEVSLVKYNADGTATTVQSNTIQIKKCSGDYYAYADKYEQVLVKFDDPLEVGKYAVTFKRLGDNGKFVWNAQMVPTADLCIIEPVASPAGAGQITASGDLIQVKGSASEITLTAATLDGESWISFENWTIDDAVVGSETAYTFTPSASTKVVANYDITPQNIPAALADFATTQAVLYPANPSNSSNSIYWYPNTGGRDNFVYIRDGNYATYFVKSTKPALYNLKFKTSNKNYETSAYIVDVINADGDVIFTQQNDIKKTSDWYDDAMNQENVAITTPLMPNEVYSVRLTFISKDGRTDEIANFNFVEFEVAAIVPETIALDKAEAIVKVGFDDTLAATLGTSTNDAIDEDYAGIEWTSSDPAIATVDADGKVTGVAAGTVTITAQATGRTDIELTAECTVTVPQPVTDITAAAAQEMYVGNEVELSAVAAPENAADKSLTWASSDTDVVEVDADGKLTAKKAGEATITVTAADRGVVSKTIAVTVHQPVTGITLSETSKDMLVGQTLALTATVAPTEPAPYNKNLEWTSSNAEVATVSIVDGVVTVTAVGKGTANIIATAADGQGATAQCAITVTIPVATITLPEAEHLFTGTTVTLTPAIAPANADNKALTWTSSAAAVATVDNGVVTAVSAGTAVITATAADGSGVTAQTTVTVTVAVTEITLNAGATKTMHKGDTFTMTATTNADATDKTVTWTSDDEAVATVSAEGVVTAKAGGVANITATANDGSGVSATCAVTVDVPVTNVTLNQTSATVYKDEEIQLTATVNPEDATVKTVTWTTSNAAVATVTSSGLVKAISSGDAVITVKSTADDTKSATFAIHVMAASAAGTGANQLLFHEEVNDSNFGDNCIAWDNATSQKWVANSIVLSDASAYTNPYNVAATSLTYTRNFTSDNWVPLYIPFNMSYGEWSADAQVAELAGVHMYDDGRPTVIEFITVKDGDIKPNVPYVIKPKAAGEITFNCSNKTLAASPAEGAKFISCGTPRWTYKFYGNYQPISPVDESYFIMGSGKFMHPASDATLSPMRFYIVRSHSDNGYWDAPAHFNLDEEILIMVDGNVIDTSGIFEVIVEGEDGLYYDLNGRVVTNPRHGFYIHNGQKIYIK